LIGIKRSVSGITLKLIMTASTMDERATFGIEEANITVSQKAECGIVITQPGFIWPALR
jgi:hypothetical protein